MALLMTPLRRAPSSLSSVRHPRTLCAHRSIRGFRSTLAALGRTLDTPFISDTVPLAEGILGEIALCMCDVFGADGSLLPAAVSSVQDHTQHLMLAGTVEELLLNVGDEVKEMEVIAV